MFWFIFQHVESMDNVFMSLLLFVTLVDLGCCTQRTLRSWVNPDCGEICKDQNLTTVYLRADGPNDTLHYLWDFGGTPSVLLALTSSSASLNVSWPRFIARKEKSVTFTEEPVYTFGVIINKIIEFDDLNDTALINISNMKSKNDLYPRFFHWERKAVSQQSNLVSLDMEASHYNDTAMNITRNGKINLSLKGFCSLDHSEMMPHMLHTENSTQVDIILDNVETNKTFTNSRFAIELLVVGGGNPDIPMFVNPKKSLDDEHTPGIFEVVEVRTPPYNNMDDYQSAGAYLQWRPVSYTTESREATSSTETLQYQPVKVTNHSLAIRNSMLYCYYGDEVKDLLVQRVIVSLGMKGDGYYKSTSYSTWTFLIGYGTPPDEQFSYLVILIISIGVGLPLVIMLGAGLYVCIRKMPKRNTELYINR